MALGQKFYNINYKDSLKKNRDLKSIEKVHLRIVSDYKNGKLECLSIIEDSDDLNRIKSIAEKFKNYDNVLIIGTGGSSLGGKTLVSLKRNHFIDNKKLDWHIARLRECGKLRLAGIEFAPEK